MFLRRATPAGSSIIGYAGRRHCAGGLSGLAKVAGASQVSASDTVTTVTQPIT
jgi:hypothetical protein